MNNHLYCFLALLPLTLVTFAGEEPKAACCAEEKPVVPACCAVLENADTAAAGFSARSLYQLDAAWTDDQSHAVTLASLRGQPVVVAMFFSSCTYACPMLVNDMQRIRAALPTAAAARAKFLLVSFDTARDTPAALRAFRERSAIDAGWTLLRGDEDAVQELAMLLGVKFKLEPSGQFSHSNLITVLNPAGEIAYQRPGLMGDVSEATQAVVTAAQLP